MIKGPAVLINTDDDPFYWYLPAGGDAESRREGLWSAAQREKDSLLGLAYTRAGTGELQPTPEEIESFAVAEQLLDTRLVWWLVNADSFAELYWAGPAVGDYQRVPAMYPPPWVPALREVSEVCQRRISVDPV